MPVGTFVNAAAIVVGGFIGLLFRGFIPERITKTIMQVLGIFTASLGIKMLLAGRQDLVILVSLVLGALIGELLQIEDAIERLGKKADELAHSQGEGIGRGFVPTTLLYCVGSMAIVGSLTEGVTGDARILLTKAVIDGIASIAFAATLGYGVLFASIPILVYQGGMTVLARYLQPVMAGPVINEVSATGGFILLLLSLNMLEIKKVRVANLLPALIIVAVAMLIKTRM
ncbi:MAG TPA: DUF554 domain-containing protein [Bacillota bacterium]|nr:DUF554 domain-containing protein [Bacillota bacterium]